MAMAPSRIALFAAACSAAVAVASRDASCAAHERCRSLGLPGSCCPTEHGFVLDCCTKGDAQAAPPPLAAAPVAPCQMASQALPTVVPQGQPDAGRCQLGAIPVVPCQMASQSLPTQITGHVAQTVAAPDPMSALARAATAPHAPAQHLPAVYEYKGVDYHSEEELERAIRSATQPVMQNTPKPACGGAVPDGQPVPHAPTQYLPAVYEYKGVVYNSEEELERAIRSATQPVMQDTPKPACGGAVPDGKPGAADRRAARPDGQPDCGSGAAVPVGQPAPHAPTQHLPAVYTYKGVDYHSEEELHRAIRSATQPVMQVTPKPASGGAVPDGKAVYTYKGVDYHSEEELERAIRSAMQPVMQDTPKPASGGAVPDGKPAPHAPMQYRPTVYEYKGVVYNSEEEAKRAMNVDWNGN